MAKVLDNVFLEYASGGVGRQLVIRQTATGPVLAAWPKGRRTPPTSRERDGQQRFREAIAYAKQNKTRAEYVAVGKVRDRAPYTVATADFLHPPEVLPIDLASYHGRVGDLIRARVVDDVSVVRVGIVITTEDDVVIEQGPMVREGADPEMWLYGATQEARASHVQVLVDASDLPGHIAKNSATTT